MRTFIKGGLVVDATGREPLPGGTVALEAGRVVAVGAAAQFSDSPEGAEVIDASGCTVMPGLIDSHVHAISFARRSGFTESEATIWGSNYLQAPLRSGITTIRDLGEQYEAIFTLKKGIQSGWLMGPRLLACGQAICMTGGHGWETYSIEADGVDAVRRAARQQIKLGADVVKLMASGGSTTANELPTSTQLGFEELRAGVEEAHKAGIPASAHANPVLAVKNAILAGIDSIEHGTYMDDECIELLLKHDVVYCPTVSISCRLAEAGQYGISKPYMAERASTMRHWRFESLKKAAAAGVRIALGTDCGGAWHPLGDVMLELELMVQAGMKPLAVIEAATRMAAKNCHIDQEVGTLEPGKLADVLIVGGDATADISAIGRVRRVLREGVTVHDAAATEAATRLIGRPVMGPLPKWLQA